MADCERCSRKGRHGVEGTHPVNGRNLCDSCFALFSPSPEDEQVKTAEKTSVRTDEEIKKGWKSSVAPHQLDWKRIRERVESGESRRDIADEFGISYSTVWLRTKQKSHNRREPVKRNPSPENPITRASNDMKHQDTGRSVTIAITGAALRELIVSLHNSAENLEKSEIAAYRSKAYVFAELATALDKKFAEEFEEKSQ